MTELVKNNNGGAVYQVSKWTQLDRFLTLGSEANYYSSEQQMTIENARNVQACIKEDGVRAVNRIVEISDSGRAPKNDPALFALAIASADDNVQTRKAALTALPKVARIGTHLFHFAHYVQNFRGWGRALRQAIGNWYTEQSVEGLAMQVIKYQSRDGFSTRDLLRLSHPKTNDVAKDAVFRWVVGGKESLGNTRVSVDPKTRAKVNVAVPDRTGSLPAVINAFEEAKTLDVKTDVSKMVDLIKTHNLPREAVPTAFLNEKEVWVALLHAGKYGMPMTALMRNLNKITQLGILDDKTELDFVVGKLTNKESVKAARMHPFNILVSWKTYSAGKGFKGDMSWVPNKEVVTALENMYYLSFGFIEPTGKKLLLALDVSGSMSSPCMGSQILACYEVVACLAMVTARVEKDYEMVAFTSSGGAWNRGGTKLTKLNVTPTMTFDQVIKQVQRSDFGRTDCALPASYAIENNLDFDGILIMTDNETYGSSQTPYDALQKLRRQSGKEVRQVVVGMTATNFSIANPNDPLSLDVSGADSSMPQVVSDFFRGVI